MADHAFLGRCGGCAVARWARRLQFPYSGGAADLVDLIRAAVSLGRKAEAVFWIAFKMLVGNRGKYIGMVLGITFAALLIGQQMDVFIDVPAAATSAASPESPRGTNR